MDVLYLLQFENLKLQMHSWIGLFWVLSFVGVRLWSLNQGETHLDEPCNPLLSLCSFSQVPNIVNILWDALLELDDLTASTNSIMTLLSSLLTYPQVRECKYGHRSPDSHNSFALWSLKCVTGAHGVVVVSDLSLACISSVKDVGQLHKPSY